MTPSASSIWNRHRTIGCSRACRWPCITVVPAPAVRRWRRGFPRWCCPLATTSRSGRIAWPSVALRRRRWRVPGCSQKPWPLPSIRRARRPCVRPRAHSVNGLARKTVSALRSINWKPGNCLNRRQWRPRRPLAPSSTPSHKHGGAAHPPAAVDARTAARYGSAWLAATHCALPACGTIGLPRLISPACAIPLWTCCVASPSSG